MELHRYRTPILFHQERLDHDDAVASVPSSNLLNKTEAKHDSAVVVLHQIQETETVYRKILESSQTLLHVLRREMIEASRTPDGQIVVVFDKETPSTKMRCRSCDGIGLGPKQDGTSLKCSL